MDGLEQLLEFSVVRHLPVYSSSLRDDNAAAARGGPLSDERALRVAFHCQPCLRWRGWRAIPFSSLRPSANEAEASGVG
jgi:hypothetical protein